VKVRVRRMANGRWLRRIAFHGVELTSWHDTREAALRGAARSMAILAASVAVAEGRASLVIERRAILANWRGAAA